MGRGSNTLSSLEKTRRSSSKSAIDGTREMRVLITLVTELESVPQERAESHEDDEVRRNDLGQDKRCTMDRRCEFVMVAFSNRARRSRGEERRCVGIGGWPLHKRPTQAQKGTEDRSSIFREMNNAETNTRGPAWVQRRYEAARRLNLD